MRRAAIKLPPRFAQELRLRKAVPSLRPGHCATLSMNLDEVSDRFTRVQPEGQRIIDAVHIGLGFDAPPGVIGDPRRREPFIATLTYQILLSSGALSEFLSTNSKASSNAGLDQRLTSRAPNAIVVPGGNARDAFYNLIIFDERSSKDLPERALDLREVISGPDLSGATERWFDRRITPASRDLRPGEIPYRREDEVLQAARWLGLGDFAAAALDTGRLGLLVARPPETVSTSIPGKPAGVRLLGDN